MFIFASAAVVKEVAPALIPTPKLNFIVTTGIAVAAIVAAAVFELLRYTAHPSLSMTRRNFAEALPETVEVAMPVSVIVSTLAFLATSWKFAVDEATSIHEFVGDA